MLSVVIPSYNEEENILSAQREISRILDDNHIDFELIFVDDGSKDHTWQKILEASDVRNVRGIRFSRNFGKEAAILAGLETSTGDCVCVIDCDLQHPPEVIPEMYKKWLDGASVVEGKKSSRGSEQASYGLMSRLFYKLMKLFSGFDMTGASDFKLLGRDAVDAILSLGEQGSFFRALSHWIGFESAEVFYDVHERTEGVRKWTNKKLLGYAIRNLASFSSAPLVVPVVPGIITCIAAVILLILKTCRVPLGSFSFGVITLIFLSGLILLAIGVAGYYLARVFDEVRARPRYIISAKTKERE